MKINPAMEAFLAQNQGTNTNNNDVKNNFGNILKDEINKVNELQVRSDEANQQLIAGESEDMHSVLLATEEARLALEMAVQIRNKLIESYQEINRMQL
jgi:flagellar hook-basal body complex protein FliE